MIMLAIFLTGCGSADKLEAKFTGYSTKCINGVEYLQFASGATVKYNTDGTISLCE